MLCCEGNDSSAEITSTDFTTPLLSNVASLLATIVAESCLHAYDMHSPDSVAIQLPPQIANFHSTKQVKHVRFQDQPEILSHL